METATNKDRIEYLASRFGSFVTADGLDEAFLGVLPVGDNGQVSAVYGMCACVKILVDRDGMSEEEAVEFLDFNTFLGLPGYPIVLCEGF